MGMYLGAIYYRSGKNIRLLILIHAIYDAVSMISSGRLSGVSIEQIINGSDSGGINTIAVWVPIYLSLSLFVLKEKKIAPLLQKEDTQI